MGLGDELKEIAEKKQKKMEAEQRAQKEERQKQHMLAAQKIADEWIPKLPSLMRKEAKTGNCALRVFSYSENSPYASAAYLIEKWAKGEGLHSHHSEGHFPPSADEGYIDPSFYICWDKHLKDPGRYW